MQQKIAKIIGIIFAIPILIFGSWLIWQAASMRLVYASTFINESLVVIPDEIYFGIKSDNMILRIHKKSEYQTYTTRVVVGGKTISQTVTTWVGHTWSNGQSNGTNLVFNGEIPTSKEFSVSITPESLNPFILEIYDNRWD